MVERENEVGAGHENSELHIGKTLPQTVELDRKIAVVCALQLPAKF